MIKDPMSKTTIHRYLGVSKDAVESAFKKIAREFSITFEKDTTFVPKGTRKVRHFKAGEVVPGEPELLLEYDKTVHCMIKSIFLATRIAPEHIAVKISRRRRQHPVLGAPLDTWDKTIAAYNALTKEERSEAFAFAKRELEEFMLRGDTEFHRLIGAHEGNAAKMDKYRRAIDVGEGSQSMIAQLHGVHSSRISKIAANIRRDDKNVSGAKVTMLIKSSLLDARAEEMVSRIDSFCARWNLPQEVLMEYVDEVLPDYVVFSDDDEETPERDRNGQLKIMVTWDFFFDAILVRCVSRNNPAVAEAIKRSSYIGSVVTSHAVARVAAHIKNIADKENFICFLFDLIESEQSLTLRTFCDVDSGDCFTQVFKLYMRALIHVMRNIISQEMLSEHAAGKSRDAAIRLAIERAFQVFKIESTNKEDIFNAYVFVCSPDCSLSVSEAQEAIGNVLETVLCNKDQIVTSILKQARPDILQRFVENVGIRVANNSLIGRCLVAMDKNAMVDA